MRKLLLSLSLLFMTAMTAFAQADYTVKIESAPENNYFSGYEALPGAEIATKLGYANVDAFLDALADRDNGIVFAEGADGLTNAYTSDNCGFWMSENGAIVNYGEEAAIFFMMSPDTDENDARDGNVAVVCGQMPNYFKEHYDAYSFSKLFTLVNGDNKVTVECAFTLVPPEKIDIAEPAKWFSQLEIVKTYTKDLKYEVGREYGDIKDTIDVADLCDVIGLSEDVINAAMDKILRSRTYNQLPGDEGYELSDSLVAWDAMSGGWYGRYSKYDEATDQEDIYELNGVRAWGGGATIYVHEPTVSDGKFTIVTGQMPNEIKLDTKDVVTLYIVNGTKAAEIKLNISGYEKEKVDVGDMECVKTITVAKEVEAAPAGQYAPVPVSVDMAAVLEALGCTADDIDEVFSLDADGNWSSNHTQTPGDPHGGFFWDEEGVVTNWGSTAAFYNQCTSFADGDYQLGQMADHFTEITEPVTCKAHVFFPYNNKYVDVVFELTVNPIDTEKEIEYTKAGSENLVMQIIPDPDVYEWGTKSELDLEYIEKLIGTQDFVIYADSPKKDADGNVTGVNMNKNWNCNPNPGFWYGDVPYEGYVLSTGWGNNSFGVTYAKGVLTWYQFPGQRSVNDEFKGHLYLVNEDNGKYVDYILVASYVDVVADVADVVGNETVEYTVTADDAKEATATVVLPVEDMFEALGITAELIDAVSISVPKSATSNYDTTFEDTYGLDANGYYLSGDSDDMPAVSATLFNEDGKLSLSFDLMFMDFSAGSDASYSTKIGFEYEGKRYNYTVNLVAAGPTIGNTDNTSGWWTAFSDFTTITAEQVAHVTFKNYSSKAENWHNWLFVAQKQGVEVNGAGADEYLALRADNYGWAAKYNAASLKNDYDWNNFKEDMDGSDVAVDLYLEDGCIKSDAVITTKDGKVYNYSHKSAAIDAEGFTFFFSVENAHLEDYKVTIGKYDPEATAIAAPSAQAEAAVAGIYSIGGAKVDALQKGINIVKMANGSVKKVYVK